VYLVVDVILFVVVVCDDVRIIDCQTSIV